MKKFLSLILALVMVMSLPVTAFAEGEQSGTTTLTVDVPNTAEPSYTLHIPADTTLTYGFQICSSHRKSPHGTYRHTRIRPNTYMS